MPTKSKDPILKDPGSKKHLNGVLGPKSLNIGYLDPLGCFQDIMLELCEVYDAIASASTGLQ